MKKTILLTIITLLIFGCGGTNDNVSTTPVAKEVDTQDIEADQNVQIAGLWGKIDDSIIEETFQRSFNDFLECYQMEGLDILEEIEGTLDIYLTVGADGSVTDDIFFESSDLGSNAVQSCMIGKIKRIQFQRPIGGDKAKVRYRIPFEEPYNHPTPFDWSGAKTDKVLSQHQDEIDACLQGSTDISFIMYIGRGGRVVAAGGSASSKEDYQKSVCLSNAAKAWKFPNPGKLRPAKTSINF